MSSLKQNIRSVLADVETFLVETLKSVKLNNTAKDHKDRLLEKIRQLLEEIPGSAGSQQDSAGSSSLKISGGGDSGSGGTSSSNLQNLADEESGYADNITKVAASDLKNKLQTGMLDKKKKSGFKTWEPLYCVVSGNIFYMYKKQGDSKQKEAFCLNGYEFHEAPGLEKDASRKDMCFEVTKAAAPTYQFRAGSKEGMMIWKEAIAKGIRIAAEEEPGEVYDELYLEPVEANHRNYLNLHQLPSDVEEIYDDLDNMPSFPAPPVPRANSLPLPDMANGRGGYANLLSTVQSSSQQKAKTASSNKTGGKLHGEPDPVTNLFKKNDAGEGRVFPSDIKGILKTASSAQSAGNKQGPPPMIDIFKENAEENTASNPQGKKEGTTTTSPTSVPRGNVTNVKVATSQAKPKSPPVNPNKDRNLPALPTTDGTRRASCPAVGKGKRSPSPPTSPGSPVRSSDRASPPPQGPGVSGLKKMFEK